MKTCVFITGTNAVGKSSLAWAIIEHFGGVDRITNDVTYCVEGNIAFAGKYGTTRYGGVDRITNEKGSSCTSRLAEVVAEGLRNADTVICEGSFLDTFGMNLLNALFQSDKQLLVSLYASPQIILQRLYTRSNGMKGVPSRNFERVFAKQKRCMIAARKYQQIGVPVLQVNTAEHDTSELLQMFLNKLHELTIK